MTAQQARSSSAARLYVADTCSLLHVRRVLPATSLPRVFDRLEELVDAGSFAFPNEVVKELERHHVPGRPDPVFDWVRTVRARATPTADLRAEIGAVLAHGEVRRVFDPDKGHRNEEADPWVLTLARASRDAGRDVVVVTEDSRDHPRKLSLATACGLLRLVRLPITAMLVEAAICRREDFSHGQT